MNWQTVFGCPRSKRASYCTRPYLVVMYSVYAMLIVMSQCVGGFFSYSCVVVTVVVWCKVRHDLLFLRM